MAQGCGMSEAALIEKLSNLAEAIARLADSNHRLVDAILQTQYEDAGTPQATYMDGTPVG
jgi:hypothetical protein